MTTQRVGFGAHLESELVGDGRLHVLVGSPSLLEDGEQRAALDVGEDEPRFLVDRILQVPVDRRVDGRRRVGQMAGAATLEVLVLQRRRQLVLA